MCGFPNYDCRRVCLIPSEPDAATRREGWSVVGFIENIVGLATRTRRQQTPYLCRILRPSSGFVSRYERGYSGEGGRMDYRKWCSGGPEDMVRGQDMEDYGSFRCS
jgi:hypothetical protein